MDPSAVVEYLVELILKMVLCLAVAAALGTITYTIYPVPGAVGIMTFLGFVLTWAAASD